jgi:type I restriction enzyme M protein
MEADIQIGDSVRRPAFRQPDGELRRFDLVSANPMWNQKFPPTIYENDPYDRFIFGAPPGASADWGWLQHMAVSLKEGGRMAVVLDTGAVSRGSGDQGSNRERDIRKAFVAGNLFSRGDLVEAVVLLPENLYYNTTAPGIILVVNKRKRHPGEILLVNGSKLFAKGRPKNELATSTSSGSPASTTSGGPSPACPLSSPPSRPRRTTSTSPPAATSRAPTSRRCFL